MAKVCVKYNNLFMFGLQLAEGNRGLEGGNAGPGTLQEASVAPQRTIQRQNSAVRLVQPPVN